MKKITYSIAITLLLFSCTKLTEEGIKSVVKKEMIIDNSDGWIGQKHDGTKFLLFGYPGVYGESANLFWDNSFDSLLPKWEKSPYTSSEPTIPDSKIVYDFNYSK